MVEWRRYINHASIAWEINALMLIINLNIKTQNHRYEPLTIWSGGGDDHVVHLVSAREDYGEQTYSWLKPSNYKTSRKKHTTDAKSW
jgi:hypothetical protein